MRKLLLGALLFVSLGFPARIPQSRPEEAGMSSERLARVDQLLKRYIDAGQISGAVSLVARRGRVVHMQAYGLSDIESKRPMRTGEIFRLASMTKPVASAAVMMLHEQGEFLLDDPVSKFLPEFANLNVAVPNAPNERYLPGYRLVPADKPVTIRHLLTHTAGLASGTSGATREEFEKLKTLREPGNSLRPYVRKLATLPLNFQPGSAWEYGPSVDVLGALVEAVSKMPLDRFLRERIFDRLGMKDTWFYLPDDRLPRLAAAYTAKEGKLRKLDELGPAVRNGQFFSGSGGLAGTAEDYFRFCQMMLNSGELDGVRILSRKTVEAMTTNQIGDIRLWQDAYRGYGFGLGFRVRKQLGQTATLGSVGEYGWGGAHGTYFWIDPKEQLIGILMIQLNPYAHLSIRPEFQNAVTQAIAD